MAKATKEQKQTLLNHEKGHMMIAIIHHRKFLNALSTFHFTKQQLRFQVDSIAKSINGQLDAMNILYDNETNHMLIVEKQQEWTEKLLKEVNVLYANEQKLLTKQELEITL